MTRILAIGAYPFLTRDGSGTADLGKIAADNTADDNLRTEAATAFARLSRDASDIKVLTDLANKYFEAAAIFFLFARRLPEEATDTNTIYLIGVGAFLLCAFALSVGRRVERTLELLNWVLVVAILGGFLTLAVLFVPADTWLAATAGLVGYDPAAGRFAFFPAGVDLVLVAALAAYAGSGGVVNLTLSNWARDKGYGMAQHAGYIPAAVGGTHVHLAHTGFTFAGDGESMRRWHGWWRLVRADQWGVFCIGAILGMLLPALLYVTFLPSGTDLQNLALSAARAFAVGSAAGPIAGGAIAFLGAWLLFKTQLDLFDGMVRALTDLLWTGSRRVRAVGDIRVVYYGVMAVVVGWAVVALRLAQPIVLLIIAANVAGAVFVISSLHLLYINTRLLPPHVRPPAWRRVALVGMAAFYGFFVVMSIRASIG
jgi:hypothetical protein